MSSLEARELTCGYNGKVILRSLSLAAAPGEVLVLLGPNGAGKSTLLRALAGIVQPREGSIVLDSQDLRGFTMQERSQRITLLPQSERRDWPLTVEQCVELGRIPHRGWLVPLNQADRGAVIEAINEMGIRHLTQRPVTQLSGGEWRRVVLARALAQSSGVLLLDEPTAGLDVKFQHEILRTARELARHRQITLVVSLHDLNLAGQYADRLAIIHNQSVVRHGTPEEVLKPDLIRSVFGIDAVVIRHPVYGTPLVAPLTVSSAECRQAVEAWQ